MTTDDSELFRRAIRGDRDAFGDLVIRHQTAAFHVAYRMLGNREDAEDITQEAFLRAFRSLRSFDPNRPFEPWLKKITVNLCLNHLERKRDLPLDPERMIMEKDPASPMETRIEARDRSRLIRRELLRLPPRYRAAIELRHFQELSYTELAEALGCPLNQIKSDLFRARRILMKNMRSQYHS